MHLGTVVLFCRGSGPRHAGGAGQVLHLAKLVQLRGILGVPRGPGHASSTPGESRKHSQHKSDSVFPGDVSTKGLMCRMCSSTPHCSAAQNKLQRKIQL